MPDETPSLLNVKTERRLIQDPSNRVEAAGTVLDHWIPVVVPDVFAQQLDKVKQTRERAYAHLPASQRPETRLVTTPQYVQELRPGGTPGTLFINGTEIQKDAVIRCLKGQAILNRFAMGMTDQRTNTIHEIIYLPLLDPKSTDILLIPMAPEDYYRTKEELLRPETTSRKPYLKERIAKTYLPAYTRTDFDITTDGGIIERSTLETSAGTLWSREANKAPRYYDIGTASTDGSRESNEDYASCGAITLPDGSECVYSVIYDGMGGHEAGDEFSQAAAKGGQEFLASLNQRDAGGQLAVWNDINKEAQTKFTEMKKREADLIRMKRIPNRPLEYRDVVGAIVSRRMIEAENKAVFALKKSTGKDGGTTRSGSLIIGGRAFIGNVGDSRTEVFDQYGNLVSQTKDHSLVQRLVDTKQITDAEALDHPQKNVIYKNLGDKQNVNTLDIDCPDTQDPDIVVVDIQSGMTIVSHCDGINGGLADIHGEKIRQLTANKTPTDAAVSLVRTAAPFSGDNDTAIITRAR